MAEERRMRRLRKSELRILLRQVETELLNEFSEETPQTINAISYIEENNIADGDLVIDADGIEDDSQEENLDTDLNEELLHNDIEVDDDASDTFFNLDFKKLGKTDLSTRNCMRLWSLHYGLPREAVESLLNILIEKENLDLPRSHKTLVDTPTERIFLEAMKQNADPNNDGEFYYFGIENQIKRLNYKFLKDPSLHTIYLDVGIDGLSIFKASNYELWPILIAFSGKRKIPPIIVAAYWGRGKPSSSEDFLKKFVDEINFLVEKGGIEIDEESHLVKKFEIHHFGCDAPAKSFIKRVQGHTGHHACNFCDKTSQSMIILGKKINVSS
jgi:hypothetical protein